MTMNKIDKRTGETFPSVARDEYRQQFASLAQSSVNIRRTLVELHRADELAVVDASNDWRLELDPSSLQQYGAFADTRVFYGERLEDDADDVEERPVEWFQRVGEVTRNLLQTGDHGLWEVINHYFDLAMDIADQELGFTGEDI